MTKKEWQLKLLNNLKNILIEEQEKDFLSEIIISQFFAFFFCGIGWAVFKQDFKERDFSQWHILISYVIISHIIFIIARTTGKSSPGQEVMSGYLFFLHLITPGKALRRKEAGEFLKEHQHNQAIITANLFLNHEKFQNITKQNLHQWISRYVRPEPSLIKLFEQRLSSPGVNLPLRLDLCYWSQLIPKLKLKLDHLKVALYAAPLFDTSLLEGLKTPTNEELENLFKNYTSENLFQLYSSPFKIEEYLGALKIGFNHQEPFAVKTTIRELYLWAKNLERTKQNKFFEFKRGDVSYKLEGASALGQIVAITNTTELEHWGIHLANCWKDYETRYHQSILEIKDGKFYLFGIYQNNKLVIGFKTNVFGLIIEAKKKANGTLPVEDFIRLQDHINNKIKMTSNVL